MAGPEIDPLVKRAVADAALERAAAELRKLLKELAAAIDPFPSFPNVASLQAIEVTPGAAGGAERGCVVVCPDGELYELVLRLLPGPLDTGGVEPVEELHELELPPGDYVAYACAAVRELARVLEELQARKAQ